MQFLNFVIYIWVFFFYSLRNLTVLIYTDDNKNQNITMYMFMYIDSSMSH